MSYYEKKNGGRQLLNEELLDQVAGGNDDVKGKYPCNCTCVYCGQTFYCSKEQEMAKHMTECDAMKAYFGLT